MCSTVPGAADRHRVPRQDCEAGAWSLSGISLLLDLKVRPVWIVSKYADFCQIFCEHFTFSQELSEDPGLYDLQVVNESST